MCRPIRDHIISGAKSDLNSIHNEVAKFIDADGDTNSNKTDKDISGEKPENYTVAIWDFAWDVATAESIDALCKKMPQIDRFDWMKKTEPKKTTKTDLFHLLDTNNDGDVTKSEMDVLYSELDLEHNGKIKPEKITQWIDDNLDSICYKTRPEIIQGLKTA